MEGRQVADTFPSQDERTDTGANYSQLFDEMCGYYLSIGMPLKEYWDGRPELVRYYRQAYKLRQEEQNQALWLQGLYVYDAILRASPVLHAFAKEGTKATPYVDKPYPMSREEIVHRKQEAERKAYEASLERMLSMATQNKRQEVG